MQRQNNNYINSVSEPLNAIIMSKEQIDISKYYCKDDNPVLYLDATSSVVREFCITQG